MKDVVKLRTSKNWFGRIGNEVELVMNGVKLTREGLDCLETVYARGEWAI